MQHVKVTANSKRGKQLITEHGDEWELVRALVPMQCFNNNLGFMIRSLNGYHSRNVRMINDRNLNVYYIKDARTYEESNNS